MSIVTSQQLARFFEEFGKTEVTFNKQVLSATGLVAKNVYLKVLDRQWPCVVFSSSMTTSRVIVTVKEAFLTALRKANNRLSLRWCFKLTENPEPITFFVSCHSGGFTPYDPQNQEVQLLTLESIQRPPDDLIAILGTLLDANANAQRRKGERILVTPESMKKLGLESRESIITLNGAAHKGILRDLSFSGAKIITSGITEKAINSTVTVRIAKSEQSGELLLLGVIRRVDEVGGRKDIVAVGVEYPREPPMSYKLLINSYISTLRKTSVGPTEANPAAPDAQSNGSPLPAEKAASADKAAPPEKDAPAQEGEKVGPQK
ncbi:MAG TPA: PilZ domain-containing protein [Spirochaetia bacterium]|nr:PilZ domain-containing protein [Spirochaetia bacterium]